jgi:hypothetical protein
MQRFEAAYQQSNQQDQDNQRALQQEIHEDVNRPLGVTHCKPDLMGGFTCNSY